MRAQCFERTAAALVLAVALGNAWAGRACGENGQPPDPGIAAKAIRSAANTAAQLFRPEDSVVLLARMGQNLSEYGLTYSHVGYAVKNDAGTWVVVHKLNECGTARASVYEQSLEQFFMDDLYRYQAALWRLHPEVQARLRPQLLGQGSLAFHTPDYNMLAYPFSTRFQNSNGWALEVLAQAIDPSVKDRAQALDWLKRQGYVPSTMQLGTTKRLGARVTQANITFDDHPPELRWSGRIQVVTVDSVKAFMRRVDSLCQAAECQEEVVRND